MSALIKSSVVEQGGTAVRSFAGRREPAPPPDPAEPLLARIAALEQELKDRDGALARAVEKARAEGASAALEERSGAEQKAMDALQAMLESALEDWRKRLGSWECAAAGIAKEVLEQVFGDSGNRQALVGAAVRKRLGLLESGSAVRVRVSRADFGGEGGLAALGESAGGDVPLELDAGLESGECILDLALGHVDLGIGTQWRRIADLLDRAESEGVE